jgi:hypothetical protein
MGSTNLTIHHKFKSELTSPNISGPTMSQDSSVMRLTNCQVQLGMSLMPLMITATTLNLSLLDLAYFYRLLALPQEQSSKPPCSSVPDSALTNSYL